MEISLLFFSSPPLAEIWQHKAAWRFRCRQSEQNCRRLSRNQVLGVLELTLCLILRPGISVKRPIVTE
jgi:hypothetical protein